MLRLIDLALAWRSKKLRLCRSVRPQPHFPLSPHPLRHILQFHLLDALRHLRRSLHRPDRRDRSTVYIGTLAGPRRRHHDRLVCQKVGDALVVHAPATKVWPRCFRRPLYRVGPGRMRIGRRRRPHAAAKPMRRQYRASLGAALGGSDRYSAAESITASMLVIHDLNGCGDRNHTSAG